MCNLQGLIKPILLLFSMKEGRQSWYVVAVSSPHTIGASNSCKLGSKVLLLTFILFCAQLNFLTQGSFSSNAACCSSLVSSRNSASVLLVHIGVNQNIDHLFNCSSDKLAMSTHSLTLAIRYAFIHKRLSGLSPLSISIRSGGSSRVWSVSAHIFTAVVRTASSSDSPKIGTSTAAVITLTSLA